MGKLEKISAWNLTKVRSKKEVIDEARTPGAKVHFASLMDMCHLKSAELEAEYQKYKGRVVFRGVIVKDDSEACAVFYRAKIISISNDGSKSHGYHIQTDGLRRTSSRRSISLYSSKMEDAPKLLKVPKSECPDIWIRLPRHNWPKSWSIMEEPVVLVERNLYCHLLAGLLWERQLEKILLKHGWEKVANWECFFVHSEKSILLICVCG